jgi:hypothetical protein
VRGGGSEEESGERAEVIDVQEQMCGAFACRVQAPIKTAAAVVTAITGHTAGLTRKVEAHRVQIDHLPPPPPPPPPPIRRRRGTATLSMAADSRVAL